MPSTKELAAMASNQPEQNTAGKLRDELSAHPLDGATGNERYNAADLLVRLSSVAALLQAEDDMVIRLAKDPLTEVRKVIAQGLQYFSTNLFEQLATTLSNDSHSYVKNAAVKAIRQRKSLIDSAPKPESAIEQEKKNRFITRYGLKAFHDAERIFAAKAAADANAYAHSLKNYLNPLSGNIDRLSSKKNSPDEILTLAEKLEKKLDDLTGYVKQIELYSAGRPEPPKFVSIRSLVDLACQTAEDDPELESLNVSTHVSIANGDFEVFVTAGVRESLVNLIVNAYEAFAMGKARQDDRIISIHAVPVSNDKARITIMDNGPGVSAGRLAELQSFTPGKRNNLKDTCFSKRRSHGFGLPIAKKHIEESNGTLQISSAPEEGFIAEITLPLSEVADEE